MWFVKLLDAIGNLPTTFWGVVVLLMSMWIAVHYNKDIGIYFAGVGSTLLGINHFTPAQPAIKTTFTADPPSVKVEKDASPSAN